jgi:hypothetical protein
MKANLIRASILSCVTIFCITAFAQDRNDEGYWQGRLFQRVREDLDRVQQDTPKLSVDQYRLVETKHDLNELQNKMENHRYDQPELDRTIAAVEKVTTDNTLNSRDRDMLNEDLRRLRDFREHHDGYR